MANDWYSIFCTAPDLLRLVVFLTPRTWCLLGCASQHIRVSIDNSTLRANVHSTWRDPEIGGMHLESLRTLPMLALEYVRQNLAHHWIGFSGFPGTGELLQHALPILVAKRSSQGLSVPDSFAMNDDDVQLIQTQLLEVKTQVRRVKQNCYSVPSLLDFDQLYMDLIVRDEAEQSATINSKVAGLRPLHLACALGSRMAVRLLLQARSDPNLAAGPSPDWNEYMLNDDCCTTKERGRPLHIALAEAQGWSLPFKLAHLDVVRELLKARASANAKLKEDVSPESRCYQTPLSLAVVYDVGGGERQDRGAVKAKLDVIEDLLKCKANVNVKIQIWRTNDRDWRPGSGTFDYGTALTEALRNGLLPEVELLLRWGALPSCNDVRYLRGTQRGQSFRVAAAECLLKRRKGLAVAAVKHHRNETVGDLVRKFSCMYMKPSRPGARSERPKLEQWDIIHRQRLCLLRLNLLLRDRGTPGSTWSAALEEHCAHLLSQEVVTVKRLIAEARDTPESDSSDGERVAPAGGGSATNGRADSEQTARDGDGASGAAEGLVGTLVEDLPELSRQDDEQAARDGNGDCSSAAAEGSGEKLSSRNDETLDWLECAVRESLAPEHRQNANVGIGMARSFLRAGRDVLAMESSDMDRWDGLKTMDAQERVAGRTEAWRSLEADAKVAVHREERRYSSDDDDDAHESLICFMPQYSTTRLELLLSCQVDTIPEYCAADHVPPLSAFAVASALETLGQQQASVRADLPGCTTAKGIQDALNKLAQDTADALRKLASCVGEVAKGKDMLHQWVQSDSRSWESAAAIDQSLLELEREIWPNKRRAENQSGVSPVPF